MDSINHKDERHLYIVWEERFCRRVFRVDGNIDFIDGKAIFKLKDGTTVRILIEQIVTIGISGNLDIDHFRTVKNPTDKTEGHEVTERDHKENIFPFFSDNT